MFVQSGGGKVYAVLAQNPHYQLALLPTPTLVSTTVVVAVRCRYVDLGNKPLNPLLIPKTVLVGGIERSENTLRGTVMLNSGITVDKVGKGFSEITAKKLYDHAPGFLMSDEKGSFLDVSDLRDDFVGDFTKLLDAQMGQFYPAKDLSNSPVLITGFDLSLHLDTLKSDPAAPFAVVSETPEVEDSNVEKVQFGKPLDEAPSDGDAGSGKVKIIGAEEPTPDEVS